MAQAYPQGTKERDRWIIQRRANAVPSNRSELDPRRPYEILLERERSESGAIVSVARIFLTNRECPWRCLMCDLWRNTLTATVPPGAIPTQIDLALKSMPNAAQVKLYNSGSFFDPEA